ncbi:hypothetical protein F5B22DRAFT_644625 [Xylaria bambusicola]|uniref:uncharacterized protein n=1 Tax=Xylaria bambusicola TaxID=326684 RepID=UPI002007FBC7|nr:uncharacterized protein F5B22DRAFT_644625 [Xylaria bambusicola]KAI0520884.1 hypothetical protein F5B22DRAFT_644625 [Xylaria bambusicola]
MSTAGQDGTAASHKTVRAVQTSLNYSDAMEARARVGSLDTAIFVLSLKVKRTLEAHLQKGLPQVNDDPIRYFISVFFSGLVPELQISNPNLAGTNDRQQLMNQVERYKSENQEKISQNPTLDAACTGLKLAKRAEHERREFNRLIHLIAPNLSQLVGLVVTARLLQRASSMYTLAHSPACKLQLLGVAKTYYHAVLSGSNAPKRESIIYSCPVIKFAPEEYRGRMARFLASRCVLAARADYFQGESFGVYGRDLHRKALEMFTKYKGDMGTSEFEKWEKDIQAMVAELTHTLESPKEEDKLLADTAKMEKPAAQPEVVEAAPTEKIS